MWWPDIIQLTHSWRNFALCISWNRYKFTWVGWEIVDYSSFDFLSGQSELYTFFLFWGGGKVWNCFLAWLFGFFNFLRKFSIFFFFSFFLWSLSSVGLFFLGFEFQLAGLFVRKLIKFSVSFSARSLEFIVSPRSVIVNVSQVSFRGMMFFPGDIRWNFEFQNRGYTVLKFRESK